MLVPRFGRERAGLRRQCSSGFSASPAPDSRRAGASTGAPQAKPFGSTTSATKVDPSAPDNQLKYNGQHLDAGSALYNLRARNYDAADGRFTATDPIAPALLDP